MMSRKGPWEGYNLLLAFLCAYILIERETSGYEADRVSMAVSPVQHTKDRLFVLRRVIRLRIRVRRIKRLNSKMERSSVWMDNPPDFINPSLV